MIRQIRYFQAVIQNNSFSKAAENCHISQSAISQQIQALERDLGFALLERHHRAFTLTPAGEFFYKKSLILLADFDRACAEAAKIARADDAVLKIGYLRGYSGGEFHHALLEFSTKYPDVTVQIAMEIMKSCTKCFGQEPSIWCSMTSGGHSPRNISI